MNNFETAYNSEAAAAQIRGQYGHLEGEALLDAMIKEVFEGQIMLSSSFGAESAVLLDMISHIDSSIPVLFLDTRRLFGETIRYQRQLTEHFGLEDVRILRPDDGLLQRLDPEDMLFASDTNKCCEIRKVLPLEKQMKAMSEQGFRGWITGRKRFQSDVRGSLNSIEAEGSFVKINPLAYWTSEDIKQAYLAFNLPPHPLVADGFKSVGCLPCTSRVAAGADDRSGRWAGQDKSECGIHISRITSIN